MEQSVVALDQKDPTFLIHQTRFAPFSAGTKRGEIGGRNAFAARLREVEAGAIRNDS